MPGARGPQSTSLGFAIGAVVQEFYRDDDSDDAVRTAIERHTGTALVDEDYSDVADGALIWWRAEDADGEDLADLLVDALGNLDNGGLVWVLTPKPGREGHVSPADIEAAATTAGLYPSSAIAAGADWSGIRLVARGRR